MPELRRDPVTRLAQACATVATLLVVTVACGQTEVAVPQDPSSASTPSGSTPATTPTGGATSDGAMALHPTVDAFVDAWNADDVSAFVATFTEDGVLIDAGRRMDGGEAIGDFAESELMNYDVRILSVESSSADSQVLLAQVTRGGGEGFRASFDFTLSGDRISVADLSFA